MSIESDAQKSAINMLVDSNPTIITVNRVTQTFNEDTGAYTETEATINNVNIALFSGTPKGLRVILDEIRTDRIEWSALAKSDADFKSGANVTDTFDVDGKGKFVVKNVVYIETHGQTTGVWLHLELLR